MFFTVAQIASELAWPIKTMRSRLGYIEGRPTPTLVGVP
jgi:hypothetical protein